MTTTDDLLPPLLEASSTETLLEDLPPLPDEVISSELPEETPSDTLPTELLEILPDPQLSSASDTSSLSSTIPTISAPKARSPAQPAPRAQRRSGSFRRAAS